MITSSDIASAIWQYRKQFQITQAALAAELKISPRHLRRLETGNYKSLHPTLRHRILRTMMHHEAYASAEALFLVLRRDRDGQEYESVFQRRFNSFQQYLESRQTAFEQRIERRLAALEQSAQEKPVVRGSAA
jgi:transcriptional regulator with XRE-family HTH domain